MHPTEPSPHPTLSQQNLEYRDNAQGHKQRTGNTPTPDFSFIQNLLKVRAFLCSPRLEIDHQNLSMGQKQARERIKERKVKKAFATQKSKTDKKNVTQKSKTKISSRHKKNQDKKNVAKNQDKAKRHTKIKTKKAFGPNKTQKVGSPSPPDPSDVRDHRPKTRPASRKLAVYFCSRLSGTHTRRHRCQLGHHPRSAPRDWSALPSLHQGVGRRARADRPFPGGYRSQLVGSKPRGPAALELLLLLWLLWLLWLLQLQLPVFASTAAGEASSSPARRLQGCPIVRGVFCRARRTFA